MEQPELPGRVRVLHVIGSGAFSTAWYAWDPELDSPVAVKILADNWSARQDVRERFLSEARLLRRVDADGVVRVYDVGHLADGRPFLVMTYAAGGSLAARLREGPLPPARAQRLLAEAPAGPGPEPPGPGSAALPPRTARLDRASPRGEAVADDAAGMRHPGLDRAEGRTELAGDLVVRQLAQIAQHERLDQRRMRLLQVLQRLEEIDRDPAITLVVRGSGRAGSSETACSAARRLRER